MRPWLLIALGLLIPSFAAGQTEFSQLTREDELGPTPSSQHFAVEFKLLFDYFPETDSEFGSATPFADVLGGGFRMMFQGEVDYQFWHPFGSVGVGLAAGFYRAGGQPLLDNGSDNPPQPTTSEERVAGSTSIHLIPIALLFVYRFDVMANQWGIPLVPFVKLGFNHTRWRITGSNGTATYDGPNGPQKGSGGTWGWQFNAGAAVQLDFLEPSAAKSLDYEMGINHTYLFFEFASIQADSFGSDTALSVGDDATFAAGLAFEF